MLSFRDNSGVGPIRANPFYRVYDGDFLKRASGCLGLQSARVIVTSPDYNLGTGHTDMTDRLGYLQFTRNWVAVAKQALRSDGHLFLNFGYAASDPTWPFEVLRVVMAQGLKLQNTIHWIKSVTLPPSAIKRFAPELPPMGNVSIGHFKPVNSDRFLNQCHEYIFHLTRHGRSRVDRTAEGVGVAYQDKSNIKRWKHGDGADRRCGGNVWFIPYPTIQNRQKDRPHGTIFPPELARRCILLSGARPGDLVVDPFTGSGTTGEAAAQLGLSFIGFEIEREWAVEARLAVRRGRTTRRRALRASARKTP